VRSIGSRGNLKCASLLQNRGHIHHSEDGVGVVGEVGERRQVYLVCFVPRPNEPNKRNKREKPDRPDRLGYPAAKWSWQDLNLNFLMSYDLAVPPGALAQVDAVIWLSLI